jgi:hypothetical protein
MPTKGSIAEVDVPARRRIYAAAASICQRVGIDRSPALPPPAGSLSTEWDLMHDRQMLADVLEALDQLLPETAKKRSKP